MPAGAGLGRSRASGSGLLAHLVGGDEVTELQVVVRPEVDTALEALADLRDVVLEATQTGDLDVLRDDHTVAGDPRLGATLDLAAAHDRAGDVAELARTEDLADLRRAELDLLELRLEHALERRLDLVDGLVDHRVVADLDALALGVVGVLALGPDVVADDDRVGGHREVDVVHRDGTDTAVDDAQVDLVADVDLEQRVLERLDRARHVTLEDEVEGLDLARREGLVEVLERDALTGLGQHGLTVGGLTALGDLAGRAVVRSHDERVTGARHRAETEHLDRTRGTGLGDVVAVLVEHGADAAVGRAGDDRVTDVQRSGLHEHRRSGTAATVEVRLDRDRKSTRLNSSHDQISYAVFCLKKKKKTNKFTIILKKKNKPKSQA